MSRANWYLATRYDINGAESTQLTSYNGDEEGHYDWHIDVGKGVPNRKLSYTIQLSKPEDYEGGDLEFLGTETNTEAFRQQGACIIFPSFLAHKVTKVKSGTRYAVVGWVHGPTYK